MRPTSYDIPAHGRLDSLNRRGVPGPSGGVWSPFAVSSILPNPDRFHPTGLLYRANCGGRMSGTTDTKVKNAKRYVRPKCVCNAYHSVGRLTDRPHGCDRNPVLQHELVGLLVRTLNEAVFEHGDEKALRKRIRERVKARQIGSPRPPQGDREADRRTRQGDPARDRAAAGGR